MENNFSFSEQDPKKLSENLKEVAEAMSNAVTRISDLVYNFSISAEQMMNAAQQLDRIFLQSGSRIEEMESAFAKSIPVVRSLGGSIDDVGNTIALIAQSSRRNVIETEEVVGKLYATSKVLGQNVGTIVTSFTNVGIQTENIGKNVEDSVHYVQSIGLNASTVMEDVVKNMEMLNRFSFSDGVQGLTKMAAQASMLKYDMSKTADFADRVLSPEGAIEAASAFQRLGVAVGDLGDPLTMMNDALVNPGALQDSIIKVAEQFTEFDEKTKTFKINPQGILMFKELKDVTGISAAEMSKTAIASAELGRRLSDVKLDIPEDDRKLLANMAVMKDGKYQIKLGMEGGEDIWEGLEDVTKEQYLKLKEVQENAPKTMEEISFQQLSIEKQGLAMLTTIADKIGYGFADVGLVRRTLAGIQRISTSVTSSVSKVSKDVPITKELESIVTAVKSLVDGKGKLTDKEAQLKLQETEKNLENKFKGLPQNVLDALKGVVKDIDKKTTSRSELEKYLKSEVLEPLSTYLNKEKPTTNQKPTTQVTNPNTSKPQTKTVPAQTGVGMPVTYSEKPNQVESIAANNYNNLKGVGNESLTTAIDGQIDFGSLTMNININSTLGVDKKLLEDSLGSVEFKKEFKDGVIGFVRKSLIESGSIKETGMT